VASETEEDHKKHLHLLFQRLSDFNININISKCLFGATVVPFLGYLISKDGIRPLSERVETIKNYPLPIMVTDLRHFLGLISFYRRALPDAANKQAPLSDLIRGAKKNDKRKIIWTAENQQTFNVLKTSLEDAALLAHPSSNLPLVLMVDASDFSIGASLHQIRDGIFQPLAFFS
jgi:hypothetical protein